MPNSMILSTTRGCPHRNKDSGRANKIVDFPIEKDEAYSASSSSSIMSSS